MEALTGRLTRDAKVVTLSSGKEVVNFSVAINRSYTKDGQRKTKTRYVECAFWRSTTVAQYLTKGMLVEMGGEFQARAYVNTQGDAVAVLAMNVDQIQLHGKPNADKANPKSKPVEVPAGEPSDDLPF